MDAASRRSNRHTRKHRRQYCLAAGKRRYADHEHAIDALAHAHTARARAGLDGVTTTHRAIRCYDCEHCNGWHLTSQSIAWTADPGSAA